MSTEPKNLPEIEPLSDLAWRRIEEGLFHTLDAKEAEPATPDQPRRVDRRWMIAGVAACAAAAAVLFVWLGTGAGDRVAQEARTSRVAAAEASSQFTAGDVSLTVHPHSAVVVTESDDTRVVIERGTVSCAVAPREGRAPVRVFAGEVRVEVIGTSFTVTRLGDSAKVSVDRGTVTVIYRDERTRIGAGETWPDEVTNPPPEEAQNEAPEGAQNEAQKGAIDGEETARDHIEATETVAQPSPRKHAKRQAGPAGPAGPAAKARRPEPVPQKTDAQKFAEAAKLEADAPRSALARYSELAEDGGAWAAPALYASGRLQAELGRTSAAKRTLKRYLARHPNGANAVDARALLESME